MLAVLAISISGISLVISLLAFLNNRRARLDAKDMAEFKLKMEALLAAKTCEIEWQNLVNDLYHGQRRLSSPNDTNPASSQIVDYYSRLEGFLKNALENSHTFIKGVEDNFDSYSIHDSKAVLKACEAQKISMAQNRIEMNRMMRLLEDTTAGSRSPTE